MKRTPTEETPIERIYWEVTDHKIIPALKGILLHKRTAKRKAA